MKLDFPVPSFCRPRQGTETEPYNCEAELDGEHRGFAIPVGSLLHVETDGSVFAVVPGKEVTWAGVPYAPGHPVAFLGGQPRQGTLARDMELDGVPLRGGAPVSVEDTDDRLHVYAGMLARDHRIAGWLCAEGTAFERRREELVSFFPAEPITVGGVPLAARHEVQLYEGGALALGTLDRASVLSGFPCAARHLVALEPNGQLSRATLSEDFEVKGASRSIWAADTEIEVSAGVLVAGTLAEPAVLAKIPCGKGPVRFADRGRTPIELVLHVDHTVDGYPCRKGSTVIRRHVAHPIRYELGDGYQSHGAHFLAGDVVTVRHDRDEKPHPTVVLGSARTIHGLEVPAGSEVLLLGTVLRTLTIRPSGAIRHEGRAIPEGSEIALDLFGNVREVIAGELEPRHYR